MAVTIRSVHELMTNPAAALVVQDITVISHLTATSGIIGIECVLVEDKLNRDRRTQCRG